MQPTVITRPMAKFKTRSRCERKQGLRRETYAKLSRPKSATDKPAEPSFPWKGRRDFKASRNGVMQNGLYVSLSAQVALEKRLETIADNVANMNTVGFRGTGVS